ncbi:MAG TPA: FAD-dependent oxidoreductase [Solirubrobacteraceae bacterium]|nr:FAD-dependent oxidoreductase [Solirubrobacteraceae bacterium]
MTPHVVIAGGGVGALEGLLALQSHVGDRVRISLVSATRYVTYRALSVAEPFGADPAPRFDWEHITRDRDVRWISDIVTGVRAKARELDTRDGPPVPYDALLLSLGARPKPALPGAIPFAGPRDVIAVAEAIDALSPGRPHAIAFVAPAGTAWTLPLYELALMTAEHGRRRGLDLAIEVVTRESAPLGIFGAEASAAVAAQLEDAGVSLRTGTFAEAFADGKLWLELEGPLDAELVIALPPLSGPHLPGLPDELDGFVPVDRFGRVRGVDRVWAVGDMTTRPLKQGGLTAQQADVAAADIAAQVAGAAIEVRPYKPKLQGLLLTGGDPVYLERRPHAPPESEASGAFLWWPPHKVVGRHIGPYLESIASPRPR